MRLPSQENIEDAKRFIRERVAVADEADAIITKYMIAAAKEIVAISYRYNISPKLFKFSANPNLEKEVSVVISKLLDEIINQIERSSVSVNGKNSDTILGRLHRAIQGKTLHDRVSIYSTRYKYELEAFVAAGLLYSLTRGELLTELIKSLKKPYLSPIIKGAFNEKGMVANRLASKGVSYGAGEYTSANNMLTRLSNYSISEAWMDDFFKSAIKNGALGFFSYRGSSYPCSLCDSMVGYHMFAEDLPLYHAHCCCFAVPVYEL